MTDHSKVDDTPRERYLTVARVCDKLSRKKSFLYARIKNDPSFPRPLRFSSFPVFRETEIDAWVQGAAAALKQTPPVGRRFTKKGA